MTPSEKEQLRKEFDYKFTYEAGDGIRMNTDPYWPQRIFDFMISKLEQKEEFFDANINGANNLIRSQKNEIAELKEKIGKQLCPKCDGEGIVPEIGISSSVHRMCPVCNGSKLI